MLAKKLLNWTPTIFILGFLSFSLFFPSGNKFDTGKKISLTLVFAVLALVLFGFSLVKKWSENKQKEKSENVHEPGKILLLGGYVFWTILSFLKSETANFGFTEVLMLCSVALLFMSERSIFQKKLLYVFSQVLLFFSAAAGYILYLGSHHQRAFGLFYDPQFKTDAWPNAFALFVIMLWPLFFHYVWKTSLHSRESLHTEAFINRPKSLGTFHLALEVILKVTGLGIILATFVLTFSRAGFLIFVLQIVAFGSYGIFCYLKNRKLLLPWFKISQVAAIIVLSLALIGGGQYLRSHYFQKNTVSFADKAQFAKGEEVTSVQERLDFWKGGMILAKQRPFFGYGPMSFGYVYRSIQKDWLAVSDHAHNIFIKIAAESGIPAALFFLVFLVLIFKQVLMNFKKMAEERRFLVVSLCVAVLGAIGHSLVDYNFNFATNFIVFWLLLIFMDEFSTARNSLSSAEAPLSVGVSKTSDYPQQRTLPRTLVKIIPLLLFFITIALTGYQIAQDFSRILLARQGVNDAQSYFKIYNQSLFVRYSLLEQGSWAHQHGNAALAEKYYLVHLKKNPWDAFAFQRLGEFYQQEGDFKKALENFSKALSLDPKNNWTYYLSDLQMLVQLNKKTEIRALSQKIQTEFQYYLPKVKANIHYAAQGDNARNALKVLEILMSNDPQNRVIFQEYEEVIQQSIAKYNP